MKRWISLIVVAMLLTCMSAPISVFAVPGEDAHSGQMAVEADGESVEEKQAKEQIVVDEVVDEEMNEEELQEQSDESGGEELAEEAEEATDSMFSTMSNNWIYIAAGLGILVLIAVAVVVRSSKGKHRNSAGSRDYKPRH